MRQEQSMSEQPKIIIDSDWKSQAQAEKEKLAQQEAAKKAQAKPEAQDVRFEDLVGLIATQALSYLGYYPDPQTGQAMVSVEYAKLHIDMLGVLEEKTKGNLSAAESETLTKILTQLRAEFVEISKAVAKAVQEGRIKPMGGPVGGPGAAMGGGMMAGGPGSGPNGLGGFGGPLTT